MSSKYLLTKSVFIFTAIVWAIRIFRAQPVSIGFLFPFKLAPRTEIVDRRPACGTSYVFAIERLTFFFIDRAHAVFIFIRFEEDGNMVLPGRGYRSDVDAVVLVRPALTLDVVRLTVF